MLLKSLTVLLLVEALRFSVVPPPESVTGTVKEVLHPRAGAVLQIESGGVVYQFRPPERATDLIMREWEGALKSLKAGEIVTVEYRPPLNRHPDIVYGEAIAVRPKSGLQIRMTILRYEPVGTDPDEQAADLAKYFWNNRFTRCGDLYFQGTGYRNGKWFRAITGLRHTIVPLPLSQADILNGIEWRGSTSDAADAARDFDPRAGGWNPWGDWIWSESFLLIKEGGNWRIEGTLPHQDASVATAPECREIPDFKLDARQSPHYFPPPGVH